MGHMSCVLNTRYTHCGGDYVSTHPWRISRSSCTLSPVMCALDTELLRSGAYSEMRVSGACMSLIAILHTRTLFI